ncbi:protein-L-isoaspartate O-methyltransferase [Bacteriovorax sp. BSW11_IV]|uniref:protein-L-isoaspartate(D-aspartate) O-methyltransferase n=1 Tax=Bacteriovorax sp. BSW11_IV TaxID=1353529 RepID=UPI000389FF28|nr:protein-L-isoaspartate(D-aspartate) O-methyltransferase [Bacteriovorax sp. BSW11_IV]EQC49287.1 protein-L-isoaspartate O-methyltransferase [Bacteriovorax sp. BSW11_IV]
MKNLILITLIFSLYGADFTQYKDERMNMVEEYLREEGIKDERVLKAMADVPRHEFILQEYKNYAYSNIALPIGFGQTISQPYVVAYMTQVLELNSTDKVLEIGTGSGYQSAVLAALVKDVYSVEIIPELSERAKETFKKIGVHNVYLKSGNGFEGWSDFAPYSKIIVTAAPRNIPKKLIQQLAPGGLMILPLGVDEQSLVLISKGMDGTINTRPLLPVRFVPMVGE